jgi:bifunctional UDP-N-acetylglucosamine pyrophosphorylase/glucosamine-1-phosphate N-acetyltransferase
MKAVILAAGMGTRLRPHIGENQKTMVKYSEKPLLQRTLEMLRSRGVSEVVMVVNYMKEQIMEFFGDGSRFGLHIDYVVQQNPKGGTADAVRCVRNHIADEKFLLIYGDNVFDGKILDELVKKSSHFHGVLCGKQVENPNKFGIMQVDGLHVRRIIEKPQVPPSNLAMTGLFVMPKDIFRAIDETELSPRGEYELTDSIQILIDEGMNFGFVITEGFWMDPRDQDEIKMADVYVSRSA